MTVFTNSPSFWRDRLKASGIHLGISVIIAFSAALLVFGIWYPYPYREISGGRDLFLLVVTVDVILGPLITLAVFNRSKPWVELRRDLVTVALLQITALGYGLWTVSVARPVHLVFEIDRFRVVHAIDVPVEMLPQTPLGVDALPLSGPTVLAVRQFKDSNESMSATLAALQGVQLGARPDLWIPYAQAVEAVLKAAKPVSALKARFNNQALAIDALLQSSGLSPYSAVYLPLVGRDVAWTAFINPATAEVRAFMPLDSF